MSAVIFPGRSPVHRGPFPDHSMRMLADASFFPWLQQSVPGDQLIYHTGFLAIDRAKNVRLDIDAGLILRLQEQGVLGLRQVKVGKSVWEYWAVVQASVRMAA